MEKKRILIVDDEEDLTFLISEILIEQGVYDVYVAHNGKEAIKIIDEIHPDIIFLDFVMPEMKGDQVLDFINKNCDIKKVSIIFMSGLGEMVYFKKKDAWKWLPNSEAVHQRGDVPRVLRWKKSPEEISKEFGVKVFLAKPFSKKDILETLQSLLPRKKEDEGC